MPNSRYTPEFEIEVRTWALTLIPKKRQVHVRGVVDMAAELAERYAPDQVMLVRMAAWIHDVAKEMSDQELLAQAAQFNLPISPIEKDVPMLLHGIVGYLLADNQFNLKDPRLASACNYHTTGDPDMSITDKIVMLADAIEPTRAYPTVDELRKLAQENLDKAILALTDRTIIHLIEKKQAIDPRVLGLRNALLKTV